VGGVLADEVGGGGGFSWWHRALCAGAPSDVVRARGASPVKTLIYATMQTPQLYGTRTHAPGARPESSQPYAYGSYSASPRQAYLLGHRQLPTELFEGVVGMVSIEKAGVGEGDVGGHGADDLVQPAGGGHPSRGRDSAKEMVALGVDAEDEEEHAVLDGAAVEGGEDGGGVSNVCLEILEPLLDERRAADGKAVAYEAASSIPLADGDVVDEPKLAAAVGVIGDVDGGVEVGAGLWLKLEVEGFGEV